MSQNEILHYFEQKQTEEQWQELVHTVSNLFSNVTSERNTNRREDMERLAGILSDMWEIGERKATRPADLTRLSDLHF